MEIVLAKEMKRIAEDMQIRDTKVKTNPINFIFHKVSRLAIANIETNGKSTIVNRSIRPLFISH